MINPFLARSLGVCSLVVCFLLVSACSTLRSDFESPTVKVTGLRLLPSQGLDQRIGVDLAIANPNAQDLSLRGISYTIGIESFSVLSGVTSQVPTLKAYEETPVNLVVSANVLQFIRLMEQLGRTGLKDEVAYTFDAKLDFSALLPAMRIRESGSIPLVQKAQP
jgi:LEA14-like dessication related protein